MLLKSNERPEDYNNPEETSKYKVRQALAEYKRKREAGLIEVRKPQPGDVLSKGLDFDALKQKYDPAKETGKRYLFGTFRVPVGIDASQLQTLDREKVTLWITVMEKQGWDWCRNEIEIGNGVYPAYSLEDGTPDLGHRERIVRAQFKKRDIQIIKTELKPEYGTLVLGENNNVIPEHSET